VEELFKYLYESPITEKVAGGDINEVFKVTSVESGSIILKVNNRDDFPEMFTKEKLGLDRLGEAFKTPRVLRTGDFENWQYLELEYFQEIPKNDSFWLSFAEKLNKTHQITQKEFGFSGSNFIGSLVQKNDLKADWNTFLVECRLNPMIEMAVNAGEVNFVEAKIIEKFYARVNDIFPKEKPALLHGDLWSGNFLSTNEGPVLIDPAVYYGHREMDLAMMKLFGGFDSEVFELYNEINPLEKDWNKRVEYHQLYPLLVHLNLFGRSYWEQVSNILSKFS
jgi:fructosamine-3-kinase